LVAAEVVVREQILLRQAHPVTTKEDRRDTGFPRAAF
jgi:hypothetical protein